VIDFNKNAAGVYEAKYDFVLKPSSQRSRR
jgi:hypothetical protein